MSGFESKKCVMCDSPTAGENRTCASVACRHRYGRHLQEQKPICQVCGKPIRQPGKSTCTLNCDARLGDLVRRRQLDEVGRCVCCGIFTWHRDQSQTWRCTDSVCRLQQAQAESARIRQLEQDRKLQLKAQATRLRDQKFKAADGFLVAVVPHLPVSMVDRDPERLEKLREHIAARVAETFGGLETAWPRPYRKDELPSRTSARESPAFTAGCTSCRGKCCLQGEEHAFISIATIQDYRIANPAASEAEVVEDYIARVPLQAMPESCLYHTDRGCALPTEMRSDMCNHYICPSLVEMREALKSPETQGFFVVADNDGELVNPSVVPVIQDSPDAPLALGRE